MMPDAVDVQYPWEESPRRHHVHNMEIPALQVDKYPVTNKDYKAFLDETGWAPKQDQNWLKHWENVFTGYPPGICLCSLHHLLMQNVTPIQQVFRLVLGSTNF